MAVSRWVTAIQLAPGYGRFLPFWHPDMVFCSPLGITIKGIMSDVQKPPVPPPSFEFLVLSLKMQAEVALGMLTVPGDDDGKDLDRARHVIDLLAMIIEKTKGNLTLHEQRLSENTLTELRFRYVQISQQPASQPAE